MRQQVWPLLVGLYHHHTPRISQKVKDAEPSQLPEAPRSAHGDEAKDIVLSTLPAAPRKRKRWPVFRKSGGAAGKTSIDEVSTPEQTQGEEPSEDTSDLKEKITIKDDSIELELDDSVKETQMSGTEIVWDCPAPSERHHHRRRHHHHHHRHRHHDPHTGETIIPQNQDFVLVGSAVFPYTWHLLEGTFSERRRLIQLMVIQQRESARTGHKESSSVVTAIAEKQRLVASMVNTMLISCSPHENAGDSVGSSLCYYQGLQHVVSLILSTFGAGLDAPLLLSQGESGSTRHSTKEIGENNVPDPAGNILLKRVDVAEEVLWQLSQWHLRDFLRKDFSGLKSTLLITFWPLLEYNDPELYHYLVDRDVKNPFFVLPWIITYFSLDIQDTHLVQRLMDVFLVSHPILPIYLAVALMTHRVSRTMLLKDYQDSHAIQRTLRDLPKYVTCVATSSPEVGSCETEIDVKGQNDMTDLDTTVEESRPDLEESYYLDGAGSDSEDDDGHGGDEGISNGATQALDSPSRKRMQRSIGGDELSIIEEQSNTSDAPGDSESDLIIPVEELIRNALHTMEKFPPQDLLEQARYHHPKEHVQRVIQARMFQSPPAWAIRAVSPDIAILSSHLSQRGCSWSAFINDEEQEFTYSMAKELGSCRAVAASGLRSGDTKRKPHTLQRWTMSLLYVTMVLVVYAGYVGYFHRSPTTLNDTAACNRSNLCEDHSRGKESVVMMGGSLVSENVILATSDSETICNEFPTAMPWFTSEVLHDHTVTVKPKMTEPTERTAARKVVKYQQMDSSPKDKKEADSDSHPKKDTFALKERKSQLLRDSHCFRDTALGSPWTTAQSASFSTSLCLLLSVLA